MKSALITLASFVLIAICLGMSAQSLFAAVGCAGDYNADGRCTNAQDYVVYRKALLNHTQLFNEGASFGTTDYEDYRVWRANFGLQNFAAGSSSNVLTANASVPEPSGLILATLAGMTALASARRRTKKSLS